MEQTTTMPKQRVPINGVDVPTLFATINVVREQPELAKFQFRVSNRWIRGTNSRSRIESFSGAGGEHMHARPFEYDADHPQVLVGSDQGPTPVEFLLHALAACLTSGIGNIASARGVELTEVESTVTGNMDLRGILGLSDEVRNGYENIRVEFRIKGNAPPEKLREIVEQSRARSAVFDIVTNGVPVQINVTT
ncbi:MAG TPA: OsmC family protein [Acidobacteriota bacterium]|nr:OsmC family protein [Acidobacteriota bacterium]